MGCLALISFLSARRDRRRQLGHRQIRRDEAERHEQFGYADRSCDVITGGSITPPPKREVVQCQDGDNSQADKGTGSDLYLPEDILRRIHALMPMKDAARAACVSRAFLRSWRSHPNLTLSKDIFGLNKNAAADVGTTKNLKYILDRCCARNHVTRDFINKIEHSLQNHSGIGVKALKLDVYHCYDINSCYIDGWLHTAVTPGIEELTLIGPGVLNSEYDFPCSLLFDRGGNSIRYLHVSYCSFRPPVDLGCLTSLTQLHLYDVRITTDVLELLLSKSFALECLKLEHCDEITRVKIPCLLQLNSLQVIGCYRVQAVESYAPNLSTFHLNGILVPISFGNPLLVKNLEVSFINGVNLVLYARTELLSMVPNVEALTIHSPTEIDSTPMVPGKFLRLKYLHVSIDFVAFSPAYDYLPLVSFLDASPSLETFILSVHEGVTQHSLVSGEPFHLGRMLGYPHENLKSVKINGFCSARSMSELVYHILENAPSLECLTLDTTNGAARCYLVNSGKRTKMSDHSIVEARRALSTVRTYIAGRLPPAVKLSVVEPCSRCHAVNIQDVIKPIRFIVV